MTNTAVVSVFLFIPMLICYFLPAGTSPAFEPVPPVLQPMEENEVVPLPIPGDNEMQWMLMPGANGEVHVAVLTAEPAVDAAHRFLRPSDVEFYLYTRENRNMPERGFYKVSCKPNFKHFNPNRPTKLLIHGFGDGVASSLMYPLLVEAYLTREDANVFLVDWSRLAGTPWYKAAVGNTQYVGTRTARLLDHLVNSTGANLADFHIVGFSLGSHVAGITGQRVTLGRIARITGLDPASVLYGNMPLEERLDSGDAEFVEVVHTSGGYLGYRDPIGQVDFFPNGGTWPQPGCYMDFVAVCSHRRAYYYFAEAVLSGSGFRAVMCQNFDTFQQGLCSKQGYLFLGSEEVPGDLLQVKGNYYLETNAIEPYARSDDIRARTL